MSHFKKIAVASASLVAIVAAASPVGATESVFLLLTGRTGPIRGEVTQRGRENQIEVLRLEFGAVTPTQVGTGMPTGRRQWEPVKVYKRLDRATVPVMQALTQNDVLPSAEFHFFRVTATGTEELYTTVKLVNATVTSDHVFGPNDKDPATGQAWGSPVEELTLSFQKIQVTNNSNNLSFGDDAR